jgi:hypothetical protein
MPPGRIQEPEGKKIMVISFKVLAGAILAVPRHTLKIVCSRDAINNRLGFDTDARVGGKQTPTVEGSRVLLMYKTHTHTEATLDP